MALQFANKNLKRDKKIVITAVKQYCNSLEHADNELKKESR